MSCATLSLRCGTLNDWPWAPEARLLDGAWLRTYHLAGRLGEGAGPWMRAKKRSGLSIR
jgi:hypothetical protein